MKNELYMSSSKYIKWIEGFYLRYSENLFKKHLFNRRLQFSRSLNKNQRTLKL